ncbi:NAD-dependent epimerase/dehydratase family protein [Virgisporangium aurantiacum]|uniref:Reductase n=1 Tax=Virgisporangium aurantiacum TaxID=175570 RepID=A0A8J3ZI81_9ACTN|nr:NAD-dependent epimerase/dehydratase family protein [Virgisporangium aurantiacum]GIJ63412.1 reductase [Virgisporangium aurantiacum]
MSSVVVIGATGHVGTYLVPRLVRAGHDVIAVSRGLREPYRPDEAWADVRRVVLDRDELADAFPAAVADLKADVVVDMTCFTRADAAQLVDGLRGHVGLLLHCGTIWVHGPSSAVPTTEADHRGPFGDYGTWKAEIEDLLLAEAESDGLRCVVLRPGHITGPGWPMINAVGNLDLAVWHRLATGQPVDMPNFGLETVHHVHADDVAQAFQLALDRPDVAAGNAYNVVSERAMTLRGIATAVAGWFGHEADLRFMPFEQFRAGTDGDLADASWEHIVRSHSMSIDKARRHLGYAPRYTSLQAIADGLAWLAEHGDVDLGPDASRILSAHVSGLS